MQTFLPYADFTKSASVLDNKRLGKQRVETLQILKSLAYASYGWKHHPAVKMWHGYGGALIEYGVVMCLEWKSRGFKDSCLEQIVSFKSIRQDVPPWLGREDVHASHRSNLLRKEPKHYEQFGWTESSDLPYIWPTV